MGFGAALSGAAQGTLNSWADNRETIRDEAARAFQVELEETRRANAKTDRDQAATDIMNPETPTGMLAAKNAEAESNAQSAKWAREDDNKRLDRESKERQAGMKAGKDSGQIKYVQSQIKRQRSILDDEMSSPEQKNEAAAQLRSLDVAHRKLSGMGEKSYPAATANDVQALHKGDVTPAQFSAKFGDAGTEKARKLIADEENKTKTASADKLASDKKAKTDKAAAKAEEREANKGLGAKYPRQGAKQGMLGSAVDSAKSYIKDKNEKKLASYKKSVEASLNRVANAIGAGEQPRGDDLSILEQAYKQTWMTKEQKLQVEKVYKEARGYK